MLHTVITILEQKENGSKDHQQPSCKDLNERGGRVGNASDREPYHAALPLPSLGHHARRTCRHGYAYRWCTCL